MSRQRTASESVYSHGKLAMPRMPSTGFLMYTFSAAHQRRFFRHQAAGSRGARDNRRFQVNQGAQLI